MTYKVTWIKADKSRWYVTVRAASRYIARRIGMRRGKELPIGDYRTMTVELLTQVL